jgi:hypothetical protein
MWIMWPDNERAGIFFMIANAAKQTDRLPWLVHAYENAIAVAATRSHHSRPGNTLFCKIGPSRARRSRLQRKIIGTARIVK